MKRKLIIEIVEASPIEWGLIINGQAQRTWWKSSFPDGKPTRNHPKIKAAIQGYQLLEAPR